MWGWMVTLGLLLGIAAPVWLILIDGKGLKPSIGDGENVDSYRFDLSNLTVPQHLVVAAGVPRNYWPALTDPRAVAIDMVPQFSSMQGKFLVPSDIVIGVAINGQARAYPLRIVLWHEVVNDTLGGVPIVVTHSGHTGSMAVFDRTIGGEVLTFAGSGLLYNANLLLFDQRDDHESESLWSQLAFQPIAGPAVTRGDKLMPRPCVVTNLERWQARHPDSTVIRGDAKYGDKRYNTSPRAPDSLIYPVEPLPDADTTLDPRGLVVARSDAAGTWIVTPWHSPKTDLGAPPIDLKPEDFAPITQPTVHARWFAWHAFHAADSRIIGGSKQP